ncbi:hypothetical protein ISF_00487 [Cordyceps fumosorosea ARSEF 2679]|uniref:Uncharacterized protein n=1 Tax=Cordyceps fumosorosea (strain ARSEF 2679) TaxID=1081104 RepID=A0A168EAQ2_CORFA|nr:hypothetical protein ISF_00487 [Cordyceps fumosorosea ARSEF 2679]OAA73586.1 hypothetical protein ISF_00487 [Cordyceps fumosorosea ARSEF 2679]
MAPPNTDLVQQLRTSLAAQSLPPPSTSFLAALVSARTPPLPAPSLLATARARLLACDLTSPYPTAAGGSSSSPPMLDVPAMAALPADVGDARVKARVLPRDVHAQVLDVENLSLSRWQQVEEMEAVARGERTRGREVVRVTEDADDTAAVGGRTAVHRLVLQDCRGTLVYAIEAARVDRIGVGRTMIGEKVLLRAGTVVARGSVLMTPERTVVLGGKIDAWHEEWTRGRLDRLKAAAAGTDRPRQ